MAKEKLFTSEKYIYYILAYPKIYRHILTIALFLFRDIPLALRPQFGKIWLFLALEVNKIKNLRVKNS